jgi:hypothetical protein
VRCPSEVSVGMRDGLSGPTPVSLHGGGGRLRASLVSCGGWQLTG